MSPIKTFFTVIGTIIIVALGALPWWFPWILKPLAEKNGVTYQEYQPLGYWSFGLQDVSGTIDDWSFEAKQITAPNPIAYIGYRLFKYPNVTLIVKNAQVKSTLPTPKTDSAPEKTPIVPPHSITQSSMALFQQLSFLPPTKVESLTISLPDDTLEISEAKWKRNEVKITGTSKKNDQYFEALLYDPETKNVSLDIALPKKQLIVQSRLTLESDKLLAKGQLTWEDNVSSFTAMWDTDSVVPDNFSVKSDQFIITDKHTLLITHEPLLLKGRVEKEGPTYTVNVQATGKARSPNHKDIVADLQFKATETSLDIQQLTLDTPWLHSDVDPSKGPEANRLAVDLDLNNYTFIGVNGKLKGHIEIDQDYQKIPKVIFELQGKDITFNQYSFSGLKISSELVWPKLEVSSMTLSTSDGSYIRMNPSVNLSTMELSSTDFIANLTPQFVKANYNIQAAFQSLALKGSAKGSVEAFPQKLVHMGKLSASNISLPEYSLPTIQDLNLDWQGSGKRINTFALISRAPSLLLNASGDAKVRVSETLFTLNNCSLNAGNAPTLSLQNPITIRAKNDPNNRALSISAFSFEANGLPQLRGACDLKNNFSSGDMKLESKALPLSILQKYFLKNKTVNSFTLKDLSLDAEILQNKVVGKLSIDAEYFDDLTKTNFPSKLNFSTTKDNISLKANATIPNAPNATIEVLANSPNTPSVWPNLIFSKQAPDWNASEISATVTSAPVAIVKPFLLDNMTGQGVINLTAKKSPNQSIRGSIKVVGASTQPLPQVGPVQKINANINFSNDIATVDAITAELGHQPLRVDGTINYKNIQNPLVDLKLTGKGLPITRSSGMVLFGDVAVTAKTDSQQSTNVEGNVVITQGNFSLDIIALQQLTAGPKTRAANFSVAQKPFADWKLNIFIKGDRVIKVKLPVIQTSLSANFRLIGTLRDPVLNGQMNLHEGALQLPFSAFDLLSLNYMPDYTRETTELVPQIGRSSLDNCSHLLR